ncbi:MAG: hypothetical protein U0Y82_06335 [Thermoleophilia bacterium]
MWSRPSGTTAAGTPFTGTASVDGRELLSEWWAPAQPVRRPEPPNAEDVACLNEWSAVGVSAPDPVAPVSQEIELATMAEWSAPVLPVGADPDLAAMSEWAGLPTGGVAAERSLALAESAATTDVATGRIMRTRAEGTFAISGLALASGHLVFEGITFPHRLSADPGADRVTLTVTDEDNVAPGGLVVMADSGFGPSDEGFTLVLAAAAPGRFHARGRYKAGLG